MRIRQIKPAFWSDPRMAELSEATRLFYIGLWMIADDAGWLRVDIAEIARDLYGYEDRAPREAKVRVMLDELIGHRRAVVHDCGHATIPTMTDHQRMSSSTRPVKTSWTEHQRDCVSADVRGRPPMSAEVPECPPRNGNRNVTVRGTDRRGTDRKGTGSAGARAVDQRAPLTEFSVAMAAAGYQGSES
ncbi:MAG: hypothetical protein ACR2JV_06255 [Gaiellales bacterium]